MSLSALSENEVPPAVRIVVYPSEKITFFLVPLFAQGSSRVLKVCKWGTGVKRIGESQGRKVVEWLSRSTENFLGQRLNHFSAALKEFFKKELLLVLHVDQTLLASLHLGLLQLHALRLKTGAEIAKRLD